MAIDLDVQNIGDIQGYGLAGQVQDDPLWLVLFQKKLYGVGELLILDRLDQIEDGRDIIARHRVVLSGGDEYDSGIGMIG